MKLENILPLHERITPYLSVVGTKWGTMEPAKQRSSWCCRGRQCQHQIFNLTSPWLPELPPALKAFSMMCNECNLALYSAADTDDHGRMGNRESLGSSFGDIRRNPCILSAQCLWSLPLFEKWVSQNHFRRACARIGDVMSIGLYIITMVSLGCQTLTHGVESSLTSVMMLSVQSPSAMGSANLLYIALQLFIFTSWVFHGLVS